MTQEEKARAYDEVREKIALRFGSNVAEEIFSEFEMSEDEKIRKALIKYFSIGANSNATTYNIEDKKILAWLEKQGEQKSAWSEDYTERMGQIINYLKCQAKEEPTRRRTLLGWAALLKSIFRKGLPEIQIPCTEAARKGIYRIMDVLEWAADKGRISDSNYEDYMILLSAYLPRPKIAWSEEDEKTVTGIINDIQERLEDYPTEQLADIYFKEIKWLKSIKQKHTWKPSEEQMRALHDMNLTGNISYTGQEQTLIELYNDLKKL